MSIPIKSDTTYITFAQVEKHHSPEECRDFRKWMSHQTVMSLKNGETGIYTWDYERWLGEGKKTEQNADTWD